MPRQIRNPINTTNNQDGESAPKENEKYPESKLEHIEICDKNDKFQDCSDENTQQDVRKHRQAIYVIRK